MTFDPLASGLYLEGLALDDVSAWVADPIAGGIRRIATGGAVSSWLPDRRWIGGLLRGPGDLLLASGADGIVWLDGVTGAHGSLVDAAAGRPLSGVNEMVADAHGALYFGGNDIAAIEAGRATAPVSLYRREADGRVTELVGGLRFSNGLALSPDGAWLYHNETFVGTAAYPIGADGALGPARRLLDKPDCDGLAVDAEGTLWITGCMTDAIVRLRPDGTSLDPFPVPGGGATSVRFGGEDGRMLYVTTVAPGAAARLAKGLLPAAAASVLYRTPAPVAGLPLHPAPTPFPSVMEAPA